MIDSIDSTWSGDLTAVTPSAPTTSAPTTVSITPTSATTSTPTPATPATTVTTPASTGSATTGSVASSTTELSDLTGGWQVQPEHVNDFVAAAQQVRANLDAVFTQVNALTEPDFELQLGSSPIGRALAAKFRDRLSGDNGLLTNLSTVLGHLDDFVTGAQEAAANYTESDAAATAGLTDASSGLGNT